MVLGPPAKRDVRNWIEFDSHSFLFKNLVPVLIKCLRNTGVECAFGADSGGTLINKILSTKIS